MAARSRRSKKDRMQADVEVAIFAREFGRVTRGRFGHHEARTAQNPVAMRADDAGVDLGRQAEIVGINDEALQAAGPRAVRITDTILLASRRSLKRVARRIETGPRV